MRLHPRPAGPASEVWVHSEDDIETLSWSAPGGSPDTGSDNTFWPRFSSLGEAFIALEACNRGACTTAVHYFQVVEDARTWIGPPECSGKDVKFTASPMGSDALVGITPMGQMGDDHVTPTDHTYFYHDQPEVFPLPYDIRALADGYIVKLRTMPGHLRPSPEDPDGLWEDWRLIIWHSCTISTIYIHVGGIAPEILDQAENDREWPEYRWEGSPAIPVKAGQVIGKAHYRYSLDFSVHDISVILSGFMVPSHYTSAWKIHTMDPFDYFAEPLRSQLLEKNARTAEPRGGKIDFDIDGRLVGNWFLDGTVTYNASRPLSVPYKWYGHLSIVYDHYDPALIRISIGADTGINEEGCSQCAGTYGVRGNAPDPAAITVDSGLVKYELLDRSGYPSMSERNDERRTLGVFLAQMIDDRTIQVEVVPDQTADEVYGFSDAASIYRR